MEQKTNIEMQGAMPVGSGALLGCPWCGNKPKVKKEGEYDDTEWRIECEQLWNNLCNCHSMTKGFPTRKEAILAWNSRKQPNDEVSHL